MEIPETTPSNALARRVSHATTTSASTPSANRSGPRSRAGCWTCREKKVKCDERRPVCQRCVRLKRYCDYQPRTRKPYTRRTPRADDAQDQASNASPSCISDTPSSPVETSIVSSRRDSESSSGSDFSIMDSMMIVPSPSPPSMPAACSVVLGPQDHEVIHYFRTCFAANHHTKNPAYSVFSVLFLQAERHAMAMHMILALAGQEMAYLKTSGTNESSVTRRPLEHYTSALRLMAQAVDADDRNIELDGILAALWLMIVYEQKFGDGRGIGLSRHLQGTASVLQTAFKPLLDLSGASKRSKYRGEAIRPFFERNRTCEAISLFAARMIIWMSFIDAGAASCGIGQRKSGPINELLRQIAGEDEVSFLEGFSAIHRYSQGLFRTTWGEEYPQTELLDDVENRNVFSLYAECGQLRYMVAELASLPHSDLNEADDRVFAFHNAIRLVGEDYSELLEVASKISYDTDHSRRLVTNIRYVVPHYYAVLLDFYRQIRFGQPLNDEQRRALREIMNLAFQGYKHEGDKAMLRIPWPLFMAGVEADDLVHKEWILNRFRALCRYGENHARAYKLLRAVVDEQERTGERVDIFSLLDSGQFERFVI